MCGCPPGACASPLPTGEGTNLSDKQSGSARLRLARRPCECLRTRSARSAGEPQYRGKPRFASATYMLLNLLRHFGLKGTELARAQADTIRLKLLKVAVIVRISVSRAVLSLNAAAPVKDLFAHIAQQRLEVPTPS
ncbi:transposase [Stigmatella aurantiaca]|nr:transposase [Stigmatella aurantiaca]